MNIFKSEGAPFAVVILAGALGWYITTLQEALGDRLSLLYSIDKEKNGMLVARVDNISREKAFVGKFKIICQESNKIGKCIDFDKSPKAQYRIVEPYNLSNEIAPITSDDGKEVLVTAWIPPSAAMKIEFVSSLPKSNYTFQYLPEKAAKPKTLPKFYKSGLESFLIRKFDSLMIWVFVLSFVGLIVYAVCQLILIIFKKGNSNEDSPHVQYHNVEHHLFDGRSTDES